MTHRGLRIFCYALAVGVTFIMLRIEWLNSQAGGRLPNREYGDSDPAEGPVRWRSSPASSVEASWRSRHGIDNRSLTAAEQATLDADVRRAQANNSLLNFVETAGLLQYLLAPALVVASILLIRAKGIGYGLVPLVAGIVAIVMMFWRSYYTSLGW